jgi:DNA-binding CsgD family transcriptional regulator
MDQFVDRLEREHGNFRAALDWCQAHGYADASLRLGVGLLWFWGVRGHIAEGRRRLEGLLARFPLRAATGRRRFVHARALDALGRMAAMQGDLKAALTFEQQSLELFEAMGNTQGICAVLEGLAFVARQQGHLDLARSYFERSLLMLRPLQHTSTDPTTTMLLVNVLSNLGQLAHDRGDDDLAIAQLEEGLTLTDPVGADTVVYPGRPYLYLSLAAVLRDKGNYDGARTLGESGLKLLELYTDRRAVGLMLVDLGSTATAQRDFPAAFDFLSRSLRLNEEMGEPSGIAFVFDRFAVLAAALGQPERALRLTGAAAALRAGTGTPPPPAIQQQIDRQIEPARRALGRLADAAMAAGRQLTLTEATAEAQATAPVAADRLRSVADPLSPREREVAVLVGRGHTNRQIAADLILSESTVATHVQHILAKLELRSRAQIAAWVAHNKLLDEPNSQLGGDHAAVPR